jgi:hypothetical protein
MGNINAYLDKFYYYYRDGLDGGRDMRSFASFYHFVYWLHFGLISVAELLQFDVNINTVTGIVFGTFGFLVAVVRPYKRAFMNVVDTLILANIALTFLLFHVCSSQRTFSSTETCFILFSLINTIVPAAVIIAIGYRIFILLKKSSCCRQNIKDIQDEELVDQTSFSLDTDDICETPDHLILHSEQHNQENNYGSTERVLAQSSPI